MSRPDREREEMRSRSGRLYVLPWGSRQVDCWVDTNSGRRHCWDTMIWEAMQFYELVHDVGGTKTRHQ
jgi:hypothetical protein